MGSTEIEFEIRPGRTVVGYSAVYLPWLSPTEIDWQGFENHLARTAAAGLIPAVNMDTGFANLLSAAQRSEVLHRSRQVIGDGAFTAGVFVGDKPGSAFDLDGYLTGVAEIRALEAIPIVLQSFGLTEQPDVELLATYEAIGQEAGQFIAFELGPIFAPFGKIYSLELYEQLIQIPSCIAAKHSSLSRVLEWQRLAIRDRVRPDFSCLTGNDLAIDMVMYGCDYLLGLSAFDPLAFAQRDEWWAAGDPRFYELNDALQNLGNFAFRTPVPAYKHSAAQYLKLRRWIESSVVPASCPQRPASDEAVLQKICERIESARSQVGISR
jgi:dihydrodipicolinate synthase/N-acetylneuraminate lyase